MTADSLDAVPLAADVSKRDQVAAAFDTFVGHAGGLDVLFNNMAQPTHASDGRDRGQLARHHGCERARNPDWHSGGSASDDPSTVRKIISTSSIAGRQGYPSFAPYCASKFAVNALTQAAARALAEHNITCNAFAPGVVDTPLWKQLDSDLMSIGDADRPGQAMADFSAGILRGRAATPDDVVGTALYLASSDSDYLTGQVIMIDGGMVLV